MFALRWLSSRALRRAVETGRHARRVFEAQRDLLGREHVAAMERALSEFARAVGTPRGTPAIQAALADLEQAASQHLKPYPHAAVRENLEVLLVAIAVALAVRTFFLQPFKIPTGSMQPTLFGITVENLSDRPEVKIPGRLQRWLESWGKGTSYYDILAEADGEFKPASVQRPVTLFPFVARQRFRIGDHEQTVWFPPSSLPNRPDVPPEQSHLLLFAHGGARPGRFYKKGESVVRLKVVGGDHLFVDRMTYNFRPPQRGEIIVFETRGIEDRRMPQDQFYIKRLVGLGGETLQLGADRHLIVNGQRLDSSTPHFENVYSFDPKAPPADSRFSGHVFSEPLAERFAGGDGKVTLRPNHYMVMGDNTLNSFDSRAWGDFSRTNVIGRQFFVYWPFNGRFGWGAR